MKKLRFILAIMLMGLILFNLHLSFFTTSKSNLTVKVLAAIADDLPEATITCDTGGSGRCWEEDCHFVSTPLGGAFMTYCPQWSGYQADICVPEMPC